MKTENPQAFPSRGDLLITNEGMTLRDYFAAKAMQALISNPNIKRPSSIIPETLEKELEQFSKITYEYADAMLKQRNITP